MISRSSCSTRLSQGRLGALLGSFLNRTLRVAPLALSAQERVYLERQVRRHRIARSLSERCRVILRCADGKASKDVAAELGLHEHTVGKWRRRFLDRSQTFKLSNDPLFVDDIVGF